MSYSLVDKTNKPIFKAILAMRDGNGKPIVNANGKEILTVIASLNRERGNYMDIKNIFKSIPNNIMDLKTFRRHLRHYISIGIVSEKLENGRITRRIEVPKNNTVIISRRDFWRKRNNSEYQYTTKENTMINPGDEVTFETLFFDENKDILSCQLDGQNVHSSGDILSHQYNYNKQICNKQQNNNCTPANAPPLEEKVKEIQKTEPINQLNQQTSVQIQSIDFLEETGTTIVMKDHDPLPVAPKRKRKASPKTALERKNEATSLYSQGHVINPLGKTNNLGRRLSPARARPIGETGNITIAQLWAAYLDIFEGAFGDRSILESSMQGTRENVSRYFDDMRQNLLEVSGFAANNRDLYNYLVWFHDAKRISGLITPKKAHIPPEQVKGKVHLRKFYDYELKNKDDNKSVILSDNAVKHRIMTDFIKKSFDTIRESINSCNEAEMVYCLVNYGYIAFSEYLNDYNGCGGSEAKQYLIKLMAKFISVSQDKKQTIQYLSKIMDATRRNKDLESSIWENWEETCSTLLDLAIEQSEKLELKQESKDGKN